MNSRRLRSASILGGLVVAAIALVSWSQPWFLVTLANESSGHPELQVAGDIAAPAVSALAIASAAAFAAMTISGPVVRFVLAAVEVLLGASIILSGALALSSPGAAVEPAVTKATSIAGIDSVLKLIGSLNTTVWPFIALAAGALLVVVGITILLTGRSWPTAGRRYQTTSEKTAVNEPVTTTEHAISDWDELSGGADPTSR
jgi:uncharacterized membrane protein (TIGR02234 family)